MVAAPASLAPRPVSPVQLVDVRLRELVATRDRFTYGPAQALLLGPSKRVRATLVLACARAVGLAEHLAIELAAGIEVLHAFTLVHDDIEDDADTRRGLPSVHVVEGIPVAINVGDALHVLAWSVMLGLDAPRERVLDVARVFAVTLERAVAGQARDLVWTRDRRSNVRYEEYDEMVRGKTGALLAFAAAAPAALVGHAGASALYRFGEELGVAFQLLDDVAGLRGDRSVLGKPVGPTSNGVASGPALLATDGCDGTERAIELARCHVARARDLVARAGLADSDELEQFADALIAQLLAYL